MSAQVICIASPKGGAGKTVLTATFGAFLVALGKRVLLVDTDAATNGLTLLYLREVMDHREAEQQEAPAGVYDPPELSVSAIPLATGADLVPATYRLVNTEDVPIEDLRSRLTSLIAITRPQYDFIFLDAQAGSDPVASLSMSREISDTVVIVSEYDPLSAAGVERLKALFRDDLSYERTWVLLNKMLPEFVRTFSDFLELARYLSPIPWDANVVRAYSRRSLAIDLEHGNDYTLAITQTLRTLLGPGTEERIDDWLAERATTLREPVLAQTQDVELELDGLIVERAELERVTRRRRLVRAAVSAYAGLGVVIAWTFLFRDQVDSGVAAAASIAFAAFVALALNILTSWSNLTTDDLVHERQLRRREDVLEERLRRLHTLRDASPAALIRAQMSDMDH
jgi:cellulose biosynthesis protein BcsQ